jgi:replicative DNA helicase
MKITQRDLELKILKCITAFDNAIYIVSERALQEYHFKTKEPGIAQSLTGKIFKLSQEYAETTGGYKLTETVLETLLQKKNISEQTQAKFISLWYEIVDTDATLDDLPMLVQLMKDRQCKVLLNEMFEKNATLVENDNIKGAMVNMLECMNGMNDEQDEFQKEKESFDMAEASEFFFKEYDERLNNPDLFKGITCGMSQIDQKTLGFYPSQLIVVLAPSSGGKSVQMLNWAIHANTVCKKNVLYFSFEMSSWLCKLRHACLLGEINYEKVKGLRMSAEEKKILEDKFKDTNNGPYFEYEVSFEDPTPEFVEQKIRDLNNTKGMPDLVVVDYIGNMHSRNTPKGAKAWEKNGDAIEGLFKIAKRFNIPVITAQQINRSTITENRKNKENGKSSAYYQDAASGDQRLMHLATYVIGMEPNRDENICWYHPVKMRDAWFQPFAARWVSEYNKVVELSDSQQAALSIIKTADVKSSSADFKKNVVEVEPLEINLTDWGLDDA